MNKNMSEPMIITLADLSLAVFRKLCFVSTNSQVKFVFNFTRIIWQLFAI